MSSISPYFRVFRPHQWLKNGLIFLPVLAAHQFDGMTLWKALLAFFAFSFVASSVYVLNDLSDIEADRAHPRKKNRPFASGAISPKMGPILIGIPLLSGAAIALYLGRDFVLVMGLYYLVTVAYSFGLKRKIVADICILAGLYTLRIIAGGAATQIPLTVWLLAFSVFFFLSLAAVKRQAELVDGVKRGEIKASGRGYVTDDLAIISMMAIASGYLSVLVFALYLDTPAVSQLYDSATLLWGICLVLLYWISRIVMITHRGRMHDDPIVFAVKDPISLISFATVIGIALFSTVAW